MTQKHSKVVQDVSVKQKYLFSCSDLPSKYLMNAYVKALGLMQVLHLESISYILKRIFPCKETDQVIIN